MSGWPKQNAQAVMMIRPVSFGFNDATAISNFFQRRPENLQATSVARKAECEFDGVVALLRRHGVLVYVVEDTADPLKPDAVFPNNWVMFHHDGSVILFPLEAPSRRPERRRDILDQLALDFEIRKIIDMSASEEDDLFLEGTGSMVFDHVNRRVYACLSPRTHLQLLTKVANALRYRAIVFHAVDRQKRPIYHTNVVMSVGEGVSIVCLDALIDVSERHRVRGQLEGDGHELVPISLEQMESFAGNILELANDRGERLFLLSRSAFGVLDSRQISMLEKYGALLPVDIPTIEKIGGGSVRCMMAEIFLPLKKRG